MKCGRVFPNNALGLFSFRWEISDTLARDTYKDINVDNCRPVILYQICQNNNKIFKYLKLYIDNRAELLNGAMTEYIIIKDQAKQLFIQ